MVEEICTRNNHGYFRPLHKLTYAAASIVDNADNISLKSILMKSHATAPQITGNSIVASTACSIRLTSNKVSQWCARRSEDFPFKGPVIGQCENRFHVKTWSYDLNQIQHVWNLNLWICPLAVNLSIAYTLKWHIGPDQWPCVTLIDILIHVSLYVQRVLNERSYQVFKIAHKLVNRLCFTKRTILKWQDNLYVSLWVLKHNTSTCSGVYIK